MSERRTIQVLRTGSHRRLRSRRAFLRCCAPDGIHPSPRKKGDVGRNPNQRLRVQY
jgi:hypothetical protein